LRFAPKSGEQVRGNIADAVNSGVDGMMARGKNWGAGHKTPWNRPERI